MSHAHAHHVRGAACNEPPSLIKVKDSCVVTKCESLYETQHRLNFSLGLIISLICKHWKVIAPRHDALTHLRISSFYLSFLCASYLQLFLSKCSTLLLFTVHFGPPRVAVCFRMLSDIFRVFYFNLFYFQDPFCSSFCPEMQ